MRYEEPTTGEEQALIYDKAGRQYKLRISEVENLWVLKVFDGLVLAARSKCVKKKGELLVGDLEVLDEAKCPPTQIERMLQFLWQRKPKTLNYRGRGIGSSLLRLIIERAAAEGFTRIYGNLKAKDLRANPRLPQWYGRFGFTVDMTSPESGTISMTLPRPNSQNPGRRD